MTKTLNSFFKLVKIIGWIFFILLAILVGAFPFVFYSLNIPFGIEGLKEPSVLANVFWKIVFHTHIIFGALALFIGWVQFIPKLRNKYLNFHRWVGKVYVLSVLISSLAGVSSSFFANGGPMAFLGLFTIGCIWFFTTLFAYIYTRKHQFILHKNMMIYSYAAAFGGVTLRIWLPLLSNYSGDFNWSYDIVAWMSWVPNLLVARWLISIQQKKLTV